jgi:hypothetical protein
MLDLPGGHVTRGSLRRTAAIVTGYSLVVNEESSRAALDCERSAAWVVAEVERPPEVGAVGLGGE